MVMILDKAILYGNIVVLKKGLRLYFSLATGSLYSLNFFFFCFSFSSFSSSSMTQGVWRVEED